MSDDLQAFEGPLKTWQIGRFRFGRYRTGWWSCSDGSLGSDSRTALGAFFRLLKWRRMYRKAPPGTWARGSE